MKIIRKTFKKTAINTIISAILLNIPQFSLASSIDEKIDAAIKNIKQLESKTVYNKIEVKNKPGSFGLDEDDKGFVTFNVYYNADRSYAVYSNHKPHTVRVLNKVHLESWAEVLTSRHNHHIKHLYFVENEGKILGTANNANAMTIYAPNVYFHNKKTGDIVGKSKMPLVISHVDTPPENSLTVMDNEGSISHLASGLAAYIAGRDVFMINRESGKIKSPIMLNALKTTYFKNIGQIEGTFTTRISAPEVQIENTGLISGGLGINANKGDFFNTGTIKKDIELNESFEKDRGLFTLHLQNGTVEGNIYLANRQARNKVVINAKSNIAGNIYANGNDDILKLLEHGSISAPNKFKDFEHLALEGDWKLNNAELQFSQSVIMEKGTLHLNGGQLTSQKILNMPEGNILVNTDYVFQGQLTNQGKLIFTPNNQHYHTLNISDNYLGNGNIVMRVNVGNAALEHDKLIIKQQASGSTGVEITNPTSTLEQPMKGKAKLIETQGSSADAFYLVKDKFGGYKYRLSPKNENNQVNWYLYQLARSELGNLALSVSAAQKHFVFSYYDRLGATKAQDSDRLWTRLSYNRHKNSLENTDIKTTSHAYVLQIGVDFGNVVLNDKQWKYGLYLNMARDKSRAQVQDDGQTKGNLKGYGAGLYASLEHKNGYLDSWLSYNHFKNRVTLPEESMHYSMNAFQASLEAGYRYHLPHEWMLQPQFQVIYSHVSQPKLSEFTLTGRTHLTTRLGIRLSAAETSFVGSPYMELNWLHNNKRTGVSIENDAFYIAGERDVKEVKLGLDKIKLTHNASFWGHVVHRFSQNGYRDNGVKLGVNYNF
ncbi:autotransporter outer membrane beta-barrel domain-containing protein [Pasteurella sp. PK-2025]|uniref:autotransporter family protein n=1 Tax=Pasteurella sp. PK-2025 TaxID=3413133 RepID=UPI003C75DA65